MILLRKLLVVCVFISFSAAAENIVFDCPSNIEVKQNVRADPKNGFSTNPSDGLHDLIGGELRNLQHKKSGKASIIFNSSGLRADEEIEEGKVYKERYAIDAEFFSESKFQFYCMYRDAAVTLSVPISPDYKECTIVTEESEPSKNKLKQVRMECVKKIQISCNGAQCEPAWTSKWMTRYLLEKKRS